MATRARAAPAPPAPIARQCPCRSPHMAPGKMAMAVGGDGGCSAVDIALSRRVREDAAITSRGRRVRIGVRCRSGESRTTCTEIKARPPVAARDGSDAER